MKLSTDSTYRVLGAALVCAQILTISSPALAAKKKAAKPAKAAKTAPAATPTATTTAGDDEQTKLAKQYFKSAETEFSLGRFTEALDNYSKAYEAKALPAFLFNIGQCHMELAHYERAIFFYEQYLRGDVDPKRRALVNKRLEEARVQQAALDAAAQREAEAKREREQQELAYKAQEQATLAAMQAEAENNALLAQQRQEKPVDKKPLFWVAVVAAAGAVAAGVIIATRSREADIPNGDLGTIDLR
jgi:tetratricopeptide (TPR) repeat protein